MIRMIVKSRVGSDGVLRVTVPLGIQDADQEVDVTVEPVSATKAFSHEEWANWVDAMAGSWEGDFERPPQPPLEVREPF